MATKNDRIGEKSIEAISRGVTELCTSHLKQLNEAFSKKDEDYGLNIGFSVDINPAEEGNLEIRTKISFVESRVKDRTSAMVNEAQQELFEKK